MCLNDDSYVNLKSPTYSMFSYVKRYNLTELLYESLYKDNHGQISVYKNKIKNVVFKYEEYCWKATMFLLYDVPHYVYCVPVIRMHPWWNFVKNSPGFYRQVSCIIALICGSQPKYLQCNFSNMFCCLCPDRLIDSAIHVLFECSALNVHRKLYMSKIRLSMPLAMKNEFNNMNHYNKLMFILSGMNCKYSHEFRLIYKTMSMFVFEMYKSRKKLYEPP